MIKNISAISNYSNISATKAAASDAGSKSLQTQLASKEQSLNQLSSNSKLTAEEKEKERQKLQQQIDELNRKLQILKLKEENEKAAQEKQIQQNTSHEKVVQEKESQEKTLQDVPDTADDDSESVSNDKQAVQDILKTLSSNSFLQKHRIENQVAEQKINEKNILKSEIKLNELHNIDNTYQEKELDALHKKPLYEIEALDMPKQSQHIGISSEAKIIITE